MSETIISGRPPKAGLGVDIKEGRTILEAAINVSSSGDNTIVAADPVRKIYVLSYVIISAGTVSVTWKDGASTSKSGAMPLVANAGAVAPVVAPGQGHWFSTTANNALILNLNGNVSVTGHLTYYLG